VYGSWRSPAETASLPSVTVNARRPQSGLKIIGVGDDFLEVVSDPNYGMSRLRSRFRAFEVPGFALPGQCL